MSRRVFASAVLLLLVVMMCCGSGGAHAGGELSDSRLPWVAFIFVPGRTRLEPKGGTGASGRRDSFGSLALVGVGGVTVVFDGCYTTLNDSDGAPSGLSQADIVSGSIFFAWSLSSFLVSLIMAGIHTSC
ncbi:trans-sialidase [Trypanosoma cruzi]|nr:trans-sialidase [Trypanosoma cruzi]